MFTNKIIKNIDVHEQDLLKYCTMFVFEFFLAKINFSAKAGLEPVNTRVSTSTVGRLNHSSTELVKK